MAVLAKLSVVVLAILAIYAGHCMLSSFDGEILRGKSVVITGASSGIGEEVAYQFARLGCRILITARREELLEKVAEKCRALGAQEVYWIPFDMSKYNETKIVTEEVERKLGDLDFLVLNHALYYWKSWNGDLDSLKHMMDVNFMSFVSTTTKLLPLLEKSSGSVTAVSSLTGMMGLTYLTQYSATKHALHGFFRSLRQELLMSGIDVSVTVCVLCGVNTERALAETEGVLHPFFFRHSPTDAAEYIMKSAVTRQTDVYFPWYDASMLLVMDRYLPGVLRWLHNSIS